MGIEDFIKKIREGIQKGLPGKEAQMFLAPEMDIDKRFIESHAANARQGAVMILLYEEKGNVYFPLIQRPTYNGAHSGQVSLPGGKKEPGDKDMIATAVRETEEEIGVPRDKIEIIGEISPLFVPASDFNIHPVIGVLHDKPVYKLDPFEVKSLIIAKADDLLHKEKVKETIVPTSTGFQLKAPYFDIEGHVVWGATAMILAEFSWLLNHTSSIFPKK